SKRRGRLDEIGRQTASKQSRFQMRIEPSISIEGPREALIRNACAFCFLTCPSLKQPSRWIDGGVLVGSNHIRCCYLGDNLRIQRFESVDLNAVGFAFDVRRGPALYLRKILHHGEEMTFPCAICTANEFRIGVSIFSNFCK